MIWTYDFTPAFGRTEFLVDLQRPKEANPIFLRQSAALGSAMDFINNLSDTFIGTFHLSTQAWKLFRKQKNQV